MGVGSYAFLIGAPRSGTTATSRLLGRHPQVAAWYEPYFVWEYLDGPGVDDRRSASDATERTVCFIREEFAYFHRRCGRRLLLEKLPFNTLRVVFIDAVFPQARFVHLVRDGRDVVLSMLVRWRDRERASSGADLMEAFDQMAFMLRAQPYWRNRWQALSYEIKSRDWRSALRRPASLFNKARWPDGRGWGVRFAGWQDASTTDSPLAFCARQWAATVAAADGDLAAVAPHRVCTIRYEDLVSDTAATLTRTCAFLALDERPVPMLVDRLFTDGGVASEQPLGADNIRRNAGKWMRELSGEERRTIGPIVQPQLRRLGYAADASWYEDSDTGAAGPDDPAAA